MWVAAQQQHLQQTQQYVRPQQQLPRLGLGHLAAEQ
jgi:hypothetical protein